jgi:hypothetical protein
MFKVGDKVKCHDNNDIGTVIRIYNGNALNYPIIVQFGHRSESYTSDGYLTFSKRYNSRITKLPLVTTRYNQLKEKHV